MRNLLEKKYIYIYIYENGGITRDVSSKGDLSSIWQRAKQGKTGKGRQQGGDSDQYSPPPLTTPHPFKSVTHVQTPSEIAGMPLNSAIF